MGAKKQTPKEEPVPGEGCSVDRPLLILSNLHWVSRSYTTLLGVT